MCDAMKVGRPDCVNCSDFRTELDDPLGNANAGWLEVKKAASSQNFLQKKAA
jgi:hypothetical protein